MTKNIQFYKHALFVGMILQVCYILPDFEEVITNMLRIDLFELTVLENSRKVFNIFRCFCSKANYYVKNICCSRFKNICSKDK